MRYLLVASSLLLGVGDLGRGPGQHRHRTSRRRDRHQRAGVSGARPGAGLSRLLRPSRELELLLLRRRVLGVPGRQLVREQLVQRAVAAGGTRACPAVRAARSGALLPPASAVLPRLARRRAAALGSALGPRLGTASRRMGPLGPPLRPASPHRCRSTSGSYSGDRYPRAPEHQHSIRSEQYRYRPREDVTRQHFVPGNRGQHDNPGHPGAGWRGEPQRQAPPQRPEVRQPTHDNGRRNDREPHDRGRGNENGRDHGNGRDHDNEGRGRGHR